MLLKSIRINNLLSFGPDTEALEMRNLNVLIGPNGAGKSNLIDAISLLTTMPSSRPFSEGFKGGMENWLWKGEKVVYHACIETVLNYPQNKMCLKHLFMFNSVDNRYYIADEQIVNEAHPVNDEEIGIFYKYWNGSPLIVATSRDNKKEVIHLKHEDIGHENSILSQRKDPGSYPEITFIGKKYEKIAVFSEWHFGRSSKIRGFQATDLPHDYLMDNFENLSMFLNHLRTIPEVKEQLLNNLRELYDEISDFDVRIFSGGAQVFFIEGKTLIPATRLSDGTLKYLCLLAILLQPEPPPLICIEEPELGLHPDIIPRIAELLKDASQRTQLVVTTHSDILVDSLTSSPEDVVVCEKKSSSTVMKRLDGGELSKWLDKYRLGELWISGEIGGNRW